MKKHINISSVLMLIVYGAMTMVVAPLHHHAPEDGANKHSAAAHASHDCGICTYTSASVTFEPAADEVITVRWTGETVPVESSVVRAHLCYRESPRRGPPTHLS